MPSLFTLQDLDETLEKLALIPGTLKAELAMAVRSYFVDEQSLQAISSIPTEEIILKLWGGCQAEELKAKKKNFSSLKSALNKSFKDLDKAGKNRAGIILGRNNVFIVSEERKDDLLKQMGFSPDAPHLLHDMFSAFKDFFSENIKGQNVQEVKDLLAKFAETQKELRKIAGLAPEEVQGENPAETGKAGGGTTLGAGADTGSSKKESNEAVKGEADSGDGPMADEGGPAKTGSGEEVEVIDKDMVEEIVDEAPEEAELIEEELEILEADELEEAVSGDDGQGADEGGPAEAGSGEEVEVLDEDMVEEIVDEAPEEAELIEEELEILEADELEEAVSGDDGQGADEGGPAEAGSGEEVEVLDEDMVEEIVEEDSDDIELLEEEVEILEEDELEEIGESAEPMAENSHQPTPLEVLSKYLEAEEALNQGDLLRETQEEFINQILERFMPKFIKIPAGVYLVGSASPKGLEQPLRKVMLQDFYLGQAPVTNDLFDMFVRETGYLTEAEEAGYGVVFEGRCTNRTDPETGREIFSLTRGTIARHVSGATWRHPAGPGSSLEGKHHHPVVQVSHQDAAAFAAWAGKRLPTEEEWEAAARGESGRLFPWGDLWRAELGNFEGGCQGGTTAVEHFGRQAMSPFGIFDLLGNVAEWTSSLVTDHGATTQRSNNHGTSGHMVPQVAASGTAMRTLIREPGRSPQDVVPCDRLPSLHADQTVPQPGRSAEKIHILKGGSWITGGTVTAAWRQIEAGKYWANTIGFRCAV